MLYFYLTLIESPEDKLKFERLYNEYREYLFRIALNILGNEYDAEDVLHQAFLRIADNINKVGEVSSHQTRNYLVIIVKGLAINLYNDGKKVIRLPLEDFEEMKDDFLVEEHIMEQIELDALRETLDQLPHHHRDVLYLMYYEELSVKSIAKQLKLSESATKKRLERARHALQKIWSSEGEKVN